MAQQARACDDCGTDVSRTRPTGPIPRRCHKCRQAQRSTATQSHPCDDCGAEVPRKHPKSRIQQRCDPCRKTHRNTVAAQSRGRGADGVACDRRTQSRSCDDCGVDVKRRRATGQIQQRCDPCRKAHREKLSKWSKRNSETLPHYRRAQEPVSTVSATAQQSRPCDECGSDVPRTTVRGPIARRCPSCARAKRYATTEEWRKRNQEHLTRYGRERTERRQQQRGTHTCPVCCAKFTPRRIDSTYCSRFCECAARDTDDLEAARELLARRREGREAALQDPICEWCRGKPKRNAQGTRPSRFCSKRCMRAWHSAARRDTPSSRHGHGNYAHKQRTLELGMESPGVTWTQWRPILDFYGKRCAYCGSPDDIEIDHVIPITRGGVHEPGNVVPACRSCNRDKGNQLLREWRPGLALERPAL